MVSAALEDGVFRPVVPKIGPPPTPTGLATVHPTDKRWHCASARSQPDMALGCATACQDEATSDDFDSRHVSTAVFVL